MAAAMSLHGIDPMRFLTTTDRFEVMLMQAIASKANDLDIDRDRRRANFIAYEVSKLFDK